MNNIEQKNVIYNLSVNSELPYQKANQVSLKANQIIYTAINHALDKMVDNDLYNEKAIFSNASYVQGPKPEADIDIAVKADGYKTWPTSISSPESDLSILHKSVLTLQQSLSAIKLDGLASISNVRVSSIVQGKPGYLVIAKYMSVGRQLGIAYVTTNINDPATLRHVDLNIGTDSPWLLDAVEIDGTIYILMSNGVRKVTSSTFDGIETIETATVIDGVDYPTSFAIHDGKYVVGNSTGLSTYLDDGTTLVRTVDENVVVNDIASVGEFALAATDNGIYKSDVKYTFQANEIVLDADVIPKFTYAFDANVFVATNKGLRVLDGNSLTLIGNAVSVAAICEFNGKLYVGYEDDGGVSQVNVGSTISETTLSPVSIFDKLSIKGLVSYNNGEMLVATVVSDTANGIFYATPMLQKLYPIDATKNSTLATASNGDAFVTNKNVVNQVSTTGTTFFELAKNDEWNVKQFAGNYAIDAQHVYRLGADSHYVKDTTFDSALGTDSTLNGIQEVSTSYGKTTYVVYGKSTGPCIQASIDGDVLKYNGITNVNVTSVFSLSECVVVVVNNETGSVFYVISALTFFNSDKCNTLTLEDFYPFLPGKTVTSTAVSRKHVFYVDNDNKLYSATIASIGRLDKGDISKYEWLSSSPVENVHPTYILNGYGNQVDIICWNNTRNGSISASTYETNDDSELTNVIKPFGIKVPFSVGANAQDADVFDFLMEFLNPTEDDITKERKKNDRKHFGAQYMGSHTFIAASSSTRTVISSIDGILTFDNLDGTDTYFTPYEHIVPTMSTTPFVYSFANNTLLPSFTFNETEADEKIRRYDPVRQIDEKGNVARYEIIGNGHGLSALHLSPSYQQFTPTTTNLAINSIWVMPLDRNFMYDAVVSSGITNYPACIDIAFAGKDSTTATKNSGIWHLKQHDEFDASGAWTQKWTQIIQTTADIIDVFSYKMSIAIDYLDDDTSTSSCTYSLIAYSDSGVSSFDYYQQPVDASDMSFTLSTGNVKSLFSGNNIKHVSLNSADDSLLYVLSGDDPISGYGIAIVDVKNKKTILSPILSTGIFAFDVAQTSAVVATENNLCIIANFSANVSADSIPASDISAIPDVHAKYMSSKKFYCCASDNELTEFAVFYNDNNIAIWSNDTYETKHAYSLKQFSTTTTIASLQLNEGRHNYLPSITYSDGKNTIDVIQSININKNMKSDKPVVEWLQKTVEVGTAKVNQMNAYAYVYDVYFFGGALIWADATTPTSKLFYPDYQLSVTVLNSSIPSSATIRNIAVDQRYLEQRNNGKHKSIAQVFIATDAGLYYDCLSVSMGTTTATVNTYSRKELRQFKPHIPTGNLSELAALSAADICSLNVYANTLYIAVYTALTDPEFPYYIYSAPLAELDNGFDTYKVALNLEFKIPKGETYDNIKLCTMGGMNCVCAKRSSSTNPPEVYQFIGNSTLVETNLSSVVGSTATTIFQCGDILYKADENGLSVISADGSSYTLAKVGSRNPGKVLTMSYSDDRFYASGSRGLSTFTIDNLDDLSSIPELADYSLCANNGLDAFSLSGELSGIYIPQTHPSLSVVSSLKFPNALSNIQLVNDAGIQYVYVTDANGVSSFQAVSKIQTQVPATYVFDGNNVKKMFLNNEFVQVNDGANSIVKTSNAQSFAKPCTDVNYVGDDLLFGADGSTPKAYRYWSTKDQLVFSKILCLPASYQFLSVGDNVMLVAGASGVSALDIEDAIAGRWSASVSQTDISTSTRCLVIDQTNVDKWTGKVMPKVIAGVSTDLLSSENIQTGYAESSFLTLSSDIYSVFPIDCYTYLVGTDKDGLYCTSYQYVLSDDFNIIPFSTIDSKIRNAYSATIREHIDEYHQTDSAVTYINNNVMPIDMSKISDTWQTIDLGNDSTSDFSTNYKVIEKDIVESIDYGDAIQHIKVEYSNILTQQTTTVDTDVYKEVNDVSYICKKWKSGLIDLFINIPTTNTYYFPHTLANDPCYYNTDLIERQNFSDLSVDGNVDDAATTFRITLYKKYFGQINNVVNIELNAQSLPLALYKDKTYDDSYGVFFHSCIMPSLVLGQELYNDKIVIKCKCFGSDAQALHILADVFV